MWNATTKEMIIMAQKPFDNDVRACDWSPDGSFIVVGDMKGFIYLLDGVNLNQLDKQGSAFTK